MAARSSRTGAREKGGSRREPIDPADVEAAAQRLGIEQLHPEQEHVLDGVFAGRDVLMVLPTGFGKSACYQIPSMVLPQPVLVSSSGARYLPGEGTAVGIMEDAEYEEHLIDLPDSFMLALFSDGILEILPPKNLIEKEKYFLDVFEQTFESPEQLVTRLGLDRVETAPDDIAALFISKRA